MNTVRHWATSCDKPRAQTIIPLTNIKTPVELYQGANFSGSLSSRLIANICPIKSNKQDLGVTGQSLEIGGVKVEKGSWIYADETGVLLSKVELEVN